MMTNLFSVFDPASGLAGVALNWVSCVLGLALLPFSVWVMPSRYQKSFEQISAGIIQEMTILLGAKNKALGLVFLSLFLLILFNNVLGLLPYVFTASSHLVFTLALALPLWLGYYCFGWWTNTTHMLAHLVPQGTPVALMSFMVLIESVSSVIRPGTLAVRLAANMIAGHLLLALLSGAVSILAPASMVVILLSQIALLVLESAVAGIQAYVFVVLSALYTSEV